MQGERTTMTKKELADLARRRGIKGYSTMSKADLELALGLGGLEFAGETADKANRKDKKVAKVPFRDKVRGQNGASAVQPVAPEAPVIPPQVAAPPAEQVAKVAPAKPPAASAKNSAAAAKAPEVKPAPEATAPGTPQEEAPAIAEPQSQAPEAEPKPLAPKAPPLKQTWTNHTLLIDQVLGELPGPALEDRAVLMVRDPRWTYAYWDLTNESVARAKIEGGKRLTLRVHDVTDLVFDGHHSHHSFDVPMPYEFQRKWYLEVPSDGRSYLVEVGYKRGDGHFIPLVRSNAATTPRGRMSELVADRFATPELVAPARGAAHPPKETTPPTQPAAPVAMVPAERMEVARPPIENAGAADHARPGEAVASGRDEAFALRMRELSLRGVPYWSGNLPKYGPAGEHPGYAPSSAALSSWAPSSEHRPPTPSKEQAKDFWLVANCELIVYGATEPDAKVTLRGTPIELRPDGTFTFRFALPEGIHPFPIRAVNADEDMERSITITVSRDTQTPS